MADANELVAAMKRAALEAVESGKPVNVFFGEVQGIKPLRINVEQKMVLGEGQLILTRNVTDFETAVTVNWETEEERDTHYHGIRDQHDDGGDALNGKTEEQSARHTHSVKGRKRITVHNALEVGDRVILIRQQGGQKFVVADRTGGGS